MKTVAESYEHSVPGRSRLEQAAEPFLDDRERAPNARPVEIFSCARGVRPYLPLQLPDRGEAPLVAQSVEEAHAHHVAVQIPAPVHYEGLDGRFPRALE